MMIDPTAKMEAFLRMMEEYHRSIQHHGLPALVITAGVWFRGRASSNDYGCSRRWKKRNRPEARDCFYNAQSFCMEHDEARYFEGYVLCVPSLDPAEHAWVAMPDGKVVDFTLEAMEQIAKRRKLSCDTRGALYIGLEIPTRFVRDTVGTSEWYDSLAEEYFAAR